MNEEEFNKKCKELGGKADSGNVGDFKIMVCKLDNQKNFEKFGLWMKGNWYKPRKPPEGKVKTINKKFIWIANLGNKKIIMTEEEAERYMKEHPGVTVYAKLKRYELEKSSD